MRWNKKGLSTVVATLIIILLVIVAVGVVWVVVRNVIQGGAEQISLGKFTLDLKIENVQVVNSNTINVRVKRNPGEGTISGLNFVLDDGNDVEVIKFANTTLVELQRKTFNLNLVSGIPATSIKTVAIAPIFTLESGKEIVGDVKDTYTIKGATPSAPQCTTVSQCNDNNAGTADNCVSGSCTNTPITQCLDNDNFCPSTCTSSNDNNCVDCTQDIECDDSDVSTTDTCSSGTCQNNAITTCTDGDSYCPSTCNSNNDNDCTNECTVDLDCDDGDSGTTDTCSSGTCVNTQIAQCSVDSDCNDNNSSTTDTCSSGTCVNTQITTCTNGDSICPSGCDFSNDNDCSTPSWQTGLVSWWKLDSDAADSVGSNDGTVSGATATSTGCKSGSCYSFDGVSNIINLPDSSDWTINTGDDMTISAWINFAGDVSSGQWGNVLGYSSGPNLQVRKISAGNYAPIWYAGGGSVSQGNTFSPTFGTWYHVVVVKTGTTSAVFYVDGNSAGSDSVSQSATANPSGYYIGSDNSNEAFNGKIDEVMFWRRALTSSEVSELNNYFS